MERYEFEFYLEYNGLPRLQVSRSRHVLVTSRSGHVSETKYSSCHVSETKYRKIIELRLVGLVTPKPRLFNLVHTFPGSLCFDSDTSSPIQNTFHGR